MEAKSILIGTLEAILARVEDNAEKTLKILNARPALQIQRLTDYAEGVKLGLEIARNEIRAEIEIIKQVQQTSSPINFQAMTVKEFFKQAKADGHEWADAAIINMIECPKEFMGINEVNSLSSAIFNGFSWRKSKEGFEHWEKIWEEHGAHSK
jgi:hypothetical protein